MPERLLNLVANPSFEGNSISQWAPNPINTILSIQPTPSFAGVGSSCIRATAGDGSTNYGPYTYNVGAINTSGEKPIEPGALYCALGMLVSAVAATNAARPRIIIEWRKGTDMATTISVALGTIVVGAGQVSWVIARAPDDAEGAILSFYNTQGGVQAGDWFQSDAFLVTKVPEGTTTPIDFFDGNSDDAYWDGIPNLSKSFRYPGIDDIGNELDDQFAPLYAMHGAMPDLTKLMHGLGRMVQPIDTISRDEDEAPGWSQVLDPQRARHEWLRWLAQWVGYYMPTQPASWEAERTKIITNSAHRRGSIPKLVESVQALLIGTKTVIIQERQNGGTATPYGITVSIYTSEISPTTTFAAIQKVAQDQKAAGLLMTVQQLSGADWTTLIANQATWTVVTTKFANWTEVTTNPAKP